MTDKSILRLNGASQVKVVFEDQDRRVALGQAEAALTLVPARGRPFLISAGDREVRMDGGEVDILRQTSQSSAATVLTVRQGWARIYPADQPAEAGVTAGPGEEVSWTDGQPTLAKRRVNAANAFAWESHRLAYDHAPLAEVVADLNRYVVRPIRLADPSLAALPFTGVLTLQGEDVMLRRIGAALPVVGRPAGAEIVLQRRPACPAKGCAKPAKKRQPNLLVQSLFKMGKGAPAPPHLLPVAPPPGAGLAARP
jgi:transmembrane sensor